MQQLIRVIEERLPRDSLPQLAQVLDTYNTCDWVNHIKFNKHTYNRKTIYKTPYFEVKIISWQPGQETPFHLHNTRGCLMKVLWGQLEEVISNGVNCIKYNTLEKGDISYMHGSNLFHQLRAEMDTVSIHIYSHVI